MTSTAGGSLTDGVRRAVSSPRATAVAIVGGLTAFGGAVAGAVAALIAAAVLTPTEPVTAAQVALMALEYGFVAGLGGAVLGTIAGFGALRRVPLGRLILYTNAGLAAGLTAGWIAGPWAWHHMGLLGVVGFSTGAVVASAFARRPRVSASRELGDAVSATGAIANPVADRLPGGISPEE